jgi:hypothetical protein
LQESRFLVAVGVTDHHLLDVSAQLEMPSIDRQRQQPLHELWMSDTFNQHRRLVRQCDANCWDTTNAELSLRLSLRTFLRYPGASLRALRYYVGSGKRDKALR